MEQRWSRRKPLDLEVRVNSEEGTLCTRSRDVSLEGMFLRGTAKMVEGSAMVDLEFRLGKKSTAKVYRVKACIVRYADDGVGVMFLEFVVDTFRYFERLLYAA